MHSWMTQGRIQCTYCPRTYDNVANMKTHLRKERCPSIKMEKQEEIWENIKTKNEGKERIRKGKRMGERNIHKGRKSLWEIRKDWGGKWMCTRCPYEQNKESSLRNNLAMAHKETQSKNVQCPKCQKIQKHMGNLKQHHMECKGKKKRKAKGKAENKNGKKYAMETLYGG